MKPAILKPRELCDLLNYVLGLPERLGSRTILRPAISPCLVSAWRIKPTRSRVESWCEAQLSNEGVIPPRFILGKKPGANMPREIMQWAHPALRRRAA